MLCSAAMDSFSLKGREGTKGIRLVEALLMKNTSYKLDFNFTCASVREKGSSLMPIVKCGYNTMPSLLSL